MTCVRAMTYKSEDNHSEMVSQPNLYEKEKESAEEGIDCWEV